MTNSFYIGETANTATHRVDRDTTILIQQAQGTTCRPIQLMRCYSLRHVIITTTHYDNVLSGCSQCSITAALLLLLIVLGGPTKVKPTYIFVCKIRIKFEWIDKIQ